MLHGLLADCLPVAAVTALLSRLSLASITHVNLHDKTHINLGRGPGTTLGMGGWSPFKFWKVEVEP